MILLAQILTVLFLSVGLFFYVPWRLGNLFDFTRRWRLYVAAVSIVTVSISSFTLVSTLNSTFVDFIYLISGALLGFLFYLYMCLLLVEIILQITKLSKLKAGVIAITMALTTSSYGIWNAYRFNINYVDIAIEGLTKPVTIAVLADIQIGGHRGRSWLERTVQATNALAPDLILIPGDIVDSNTAVNSEVLAPLKDLKAPTYFVTGNHDTYVMENKLKDIVKKMGITVLENTVVSITGGLQLIGLEFMNPDDDTFDLHPSDNTKTIKSVLPNLAAATDAPTIIMHHSPVGESYVAMAGADLYVAGHTHGGGQVFPATIVACNVFYKYCSGLYDFRKMKIFVSQGMGTFTLPMRVGTENNLDILRLTPSTQIINRKTNLNPP